MKQIKKLKSDELGGWGWFEKRFEDRKLELTQRTQNTQYSHIVCIHPIIRLSEA